MGVNGGHCLTPTECIYDDLTVRTWTVTDACGNSSSHYNQSIIVRDLTPPEWTTLPGDLDRIVPVGDAEALAVAQALIPLATDNCEPSLVPLKTAGSFVPCAECPESGTYTNTWTVSDFCGNSQAVTYTQVITVSDYFGVSGTVNYHNNLNTPMDLLDVTLYKGGNILASTSTDATGNYSFSNLLEGTYSIDFSTSKQSGGINSSDAGMVNYWWTHLSPIEHVRWDAGNFISGDNFINASDAAAIQGYFVYGNPQPSTGYWTFFRQQQISNLNPPVTTNNFVVCGDNLSQDFYGLCVGDFNRSFVPSTGSRGSDMISSLSLISSGTIRISNDAMVELAVEVTENITVGAISLVLEVPSDLVSVEDVYFGKEPGTEGMLNWNLEGNELRIGWNTASPVELSAFSTLFTLMLRTSEDFTVGKSVAILLADDPLNELADAQYNAIENSVLQALTITGYATGIGEGTAVEALNLVCQPNPFNNSTMLEYTLPYSGEVMLRIVNKYGSSVATYVDSYQEKGKYIIRLDGSNLNPGVYTVSLILQGKKDAKMKNIKIVRGL